MLASLFIIFAVVTLASIKNMWKYSLEPDELLKITSFSILDNLESYSKTKNLAMKKDYRDRCVKTAKNFLYYIRIRWKIGSFELLKDHLKTMSDFKKNIQYRLIPSLKNGDDKTLDDIERIMRNSFFAIPRVPTFQTLNDLNQQMTSALPMPESMEAGSIDRLKDFIDAHSVIKHSSFVSGLLIGCCVFYYTMINYLGIQKEYSFTGSVALFVGISTIYFTQLRRD